MKPDPVKIIVDRILVIQNALRFAGPFEGKCGQHTILFQTSMWPMMVYADVSTAFNVADKAVLADEVRKTLTFTVTVEEFLAGLAEVCKKQATRAYEEENFAWVQQRRYRSMYSFYNGLAFSVGSNRGGVTVGKEKFQAPELPVRPVKE